MSAYDPKRTFGLIDILKPVLCANSSLAAGSQSAKLLLLGRGVFFRGAMRRRDFITVLGGAATVWPFAARGQQSERVRRVGVLVPLDQAETEAQARVGAFRQALQEL